MTISANDRTSAATKPGQFSKGAAGLLRAGTPALRVGRYVGIKQVGTGARGVVWSAADHALPEAERRPRGDVAVKKVGSAFDNTMDTKRLMREILVLQCLDHPNILGIKDVLCPRDSRGWTSLYIVTDLMETDLHRIIQSPQPLSEEHIQYFVYQLLRGVKYLHSAGILHRDIKPGNILVNADCQLRLGDFGLARCLPDPNLSEAEQAEDPLMTSYVVTRWYRAPELLLQEQYYTGAVDMWSVGCVIGELIGRKALFPGTDYIDEVIRITNVIGTPTAEDLATVQNEQARQFVTTLEPKTPIPFEDLFPKAHPQLIDLLTRLLLFDPFRRLTIDDALAHAFFASIHDPMDLPVAEARIALPGDADLTKQQLKEVIFQQVVKFHPEQLPDLLEMRQQHLKLAEQQQLLHPLHRPPPSRVGH